MHARFWQTVSFGYSQPRKKDEVPREYNAFFRENQTKTSICLGERMSQTSGTTLSAARTMGNTIGIALRINAKQFAR
jgi:hypothetical protein